jgi:glycosyltransferase involved in cell wall biosynthesis
MLASCSCTPQLTRVLFLVNDSAFFASHRLPIGRAAVKHGYEVHLGALSDGRLGEISAAGIKFHPLPVDRTGLNPAKDLQLFRAIVQLFRKLRPQIVHAVTIKPVIYGGLAARVCGVPAFVSTISGLGYAFEEGAGSRTAVRLLVERLYRSALCHPNSRTVFQNPENRNLFLARGLAQRERTSLIRGSGVDLCAFQPSPEPAGLPIILLPARLLWAKGVPEFVEAARILRARGRKARFVLVGDIPAHNRGAVSLSTLHGWQAQGLVEWWGYRSDMAVVYGAATVVCLPSSYSEGIPRALIEAAACGRPIITTDMPGCREVARHGVEGFLVPPKNASALADAISAVLSLPSAERARMGEAARARAEQQFSVERIVQQTMAIYAGLIDAAK